MQDDAADEIERIMKREGLKPAHLQKRVSVDLSRILSRAVSPKWSTVQAVFEAMGYDVFLHAKKRKK